LISMKTLFLSVLLLGMSTLSFAQNNVPEGSQDMYTAFHEFFNAEIRRQGVKLNWIFRLKEITGLHTFDLNNDGMKEVLFEFDAVPVEGGGITNSYAVLFFEVAPSKFEMGDYIETPYMRFLGVEQKVFRFYNRKQDRVDEFVFEADKFSKYSGN